MSWAYARRQTACGHCQASIGIGDAYYAGDVTPTRWCVSCAAHELRHDKPLTIEPSAVAPPWTAPPRKPRGFERVDGRDITHRILGERGE
jgi:hypothetical protein